MYQNQFIHQVTKPNSLNRFPGLFLNLHILDLNYFPAYEVIAKYFLNYFCTEYYSTRLNF